MLIAGLSAGADARIDINNLPERGGIASARQPFDNWTLIESGALTHDEADRLRPRLYKHLAGPLPDDDGDPDEPVRFVKAHDAYTLTPDGEPLLAGRSGAVGAIVIVRDPRDVAPSLANHNASSIDEAIAFMADPTATYAGRTDRQDLQLRQRVLSWSAHVASWLDQTDLPVHLVRYEDLAQDTVGVFTRAMAFSGRQATEAAIRRAVEEAAFERLQQQESDRGFAEAPSRARRFFRRGQAGGWREELTPAQAAAIEAAHGEMMLRLGYEPG
jgi:hypothetical protein